MPGGDRTGPAGAGPMTGRGAGYCTGTTMPGYANMGGGRGFGRGFGRGAGRGMAWRNGWGAPPVYAPAMPVPAPQYAPDPQQELNMLQNRIAAMEQELAAARARVTEMGKSNENAAED